MNGSLHRPKPVKATPTSILKGARAPAAHVSFLNDESIEVLNDESTTCDAPLRVATAGGDEDEQELSADERRSTTLVRTVADVHDEREREQNGSASLTMSSRRELTIVLRGRETAPSRQLIQPKLSPPGSDASGESPVPPHPAGIVLTRKDYYTIPSFDELALAVDANGDCVVETGFTVGRVDYGSVYWAEPINVAGLNLDEIGGFYVVWSCLLIADCVLCF